MALLADEVAHIAHANNIELAASTHQRLRAIASVPWKLVAPDGGIPHFGDGFRGFRYGWQFSSEHRQVSQIFTKATWELDGAASGNTLLSPGQVTPPIAAFARDAEFTSACVKSLARPNAPLGMSFQMTPRYSVHSLFDFQYNNQGTLLAYFDAPADVRSFIRKKQDDEPFFVWDEERFTASRDFHTAGKHVLYAALDEPAAADCTQRDRWWDAWQHIGHATRRTMNIRRSRPLPEGTFPHKVRVEGGELELPLDDRWISSRRWLYEMADHAIPRLAERGIKRVIPEPIVQTDPTERGLLRKLDQGIHGDWMVGSVCCVHRYLPADFWGGMDAWRYFVRRAHELGMEVGHWVGPHLAHHAPILRENPTWAMRTFDTNRYSGGYPNGILATVNWNTKVRQWILDDLKRMRDQAVLDYIWFDSLGNLGMLPADHAEDMQTNTVALGQFIGQLQDAGIASVAIEGAGWLGTSGCHIFDPHKGNIRYAQEIAGQNSWDWYAGNEDMLCDQMPRVDIHRDRAEDQVSQSFFRCLANRCTPRFGRYASINSPAPTWMRPMIETYLAVEPYMHKRRMLPGQRGVRWLADGQSTVKQVVFACDQFELAADASRIELVRDGQRLPVAAKDGKVLTQPWHVYLIHQA